MLSSFPRTAVLGTVLCCTIVLGAAAQTKPALRQPTATATKKPAAAAPKSAATPNRQAALLANEAKINVLLKQMTLQEKVTMIHANSSFAAGGIKRLGIPELVTSDGPHGVRPEQGRDWKPVKDVQDASTYLPTGNTLAATWNPELGYAFGKVLGSEAKYRGKDVILGPGINIIRTPLNGRNFEYLSEDPYLVSRMAVGYIQGVQDQGISACVKHYAANNQETHRDAINVNMSERALREIYLPGFKAAVQEGGVYTLMGAYNKFRGQWATHNAYLMNNILKGEWGFKGMVISDWGSVHNTDEALRNGTDLEMGTDLSLMYSSTDQTATAASATTPTAPAKTLYDRFFLADPALEAVKKDPRLLPLIDDKVRRILRVMYQINRLDGAKRTPGAFNTREHQLTAQKVAEEGIVLLKNEGNLLPLSRTALKTMAVIGASADRNNSMGGGSSQIKALYEITPLEGLQKALGNQVAVSFAPGHKIARGQGADPALIQQAVAAAKAADVAVVVASWTHGYDYSKWEDNAFDAEAVDKPSMNLPFGQDELIKAVLQANPRTVVVLMGGGPTDMTAWVGQAKGIVQAWYPGMEGGTALARILFGEVNPSGKLPMTFPVKLADSPAHKLGDYPSTSRQDSLTQTYREDIFVGYRYFDTYKVAPQFAFGHGLSYTTFKYDNLTVTPGPQRATVQLTLTNTGKVAGAEVVQVYVKDEKAAVKRPEKELKAFQKVALKPGEAKTITLTLGPEAFQYYNETKKQWVLEPGKFEVLVGSSSRDIRLTGGLTL
ncbi:glycoside hydrolase family 3 C-terminal domain-containing protein [Hymenobacter weizhouensis]|uniref:glycoside hydrolase family 3 C-terminal domain-containing protein n=1 Tax=Hymenobacter sp. YIM 151500-1 TaxID=2987689 RepID=UPI00222602DD|nr:glycoside hydrolase family 3 C-terminal domain-containing protein [Hymenobacter sp. YIM 151500-1]UYZ64970.1 glycoside hydrolase family 3 C-terminal domain-containing protein [Hymenobacter sp. YIM 151500-1]